MSGPRTLYDKIWDEPRRREQAAARSALHRLHLVHEVTSPQAFDGLRAPAARCAGRTTFAIADHNVPTTDRSAGIADPISRQQIDDARRATAPSSASPFFDMGDIRQGIVHIIGPEQGTRSPA